MVNTSVDHYAAIRRKIFRLNQCVIFKNWSEYKIQIQIHNALLEFWFDGREVNVRDNQNHVGID